MIWINAVTGAGGLENPTSARVAREACPSLIPHHGIVGQPPDNHGLLWKRGTVDPGGKLIINRWLREDAGRA